jgi:hypothetical protein
MGLTDAGDDHPAPTGRLELCTNGETESHPKVSGRRDEAPAGYEPLLGRVEDAWLAGCWRGVDR